VNYAQVVSWFHFDFQGKSSMLYSCWGCGIGCRSIVGVLLWWTLSTTQINYRKCRSIFLSIRRLRLDDYECQRRLRIEGMVRYWIGVVGKFKISWWLMILVIYCIHSFCGQTRVEAYGARTRAIFDDAFERDDQLTVEYCICCCCCNDF
jgi:hypothetical protein